MGSTPTIGTINKPPNLDLENLAYIIGVALGDGNLSNPNGRAVRLRISCDLKYPKLVGKIKSSVQRAFPNNKVSVVRRKQGCLDISCFSNKLEKLLGWRAKGGSKFVQNVRVPKWIFSKKKYISRCLCGLIETDGSIYLDRGYETVFFTSIIPNLANDFAIMVCILGFEPRWYKIKENNRDGSQPRYNIRLSKNVGEFLKIVNPEKK